MQFLTWESEHFHRNFPSTSSQPQGLSQTFFTRSGLSENPTPLLVYTVQCFQLQVLDGLYMYPSFSFPFFPLGELLPLSSNKGLESSAFVIQP